ncbi:unnamed protein product, partial [Urochloa humidicola]
KNKFSSTAPFFPTEATRNKPDPLPLRLHPSLFPTATNLSSIAIAKFEGHSTRFGGDGQQLGVPSVPSSGKQFLEVPLPHPQAPWCLFPTSLDGTVETGEQLGASAQIKKDCKEF